MNQPVPLLTQTCGTRELGRFCALFGPKESGDEAVTSGDKLGGMEFACFQAESGMSLLSTENERN